MKYFLLILCLSTNFCFSQSSLKVCSWNLFCFPTFIKNVDNLERIELIAESLKNSSNDVLCFQEVFSNRAKGILIEKLKKQYPFYATTNHGLSLSKINSGLIIFSKYSIISQSQKIYKHKFGIDAMARKGALQICIEHEGKRFNIINTHLQNCGNSKLKFLQISELKSLLSDRYTNIVAGDFNIDFYSDEYKKLESALEIRNATFVESKLYSYNAIKNRLIKNKSETPQLIDYVFWKPIGNDFDSTSHTITEFLDDRYKHRNLSDHFAVEAIFYFQGSNSIKTAFLK